MLLLVIHGLIENANCRRYGLGIGGEFSGYKSLFGNRCCEAAPLETHLAKPCNPDFLSCVTYFSGGSNSCYGDSLKHS